MTGLMVVPEIEMVTVTTCLKVVIPNTTTMVLMDIIHPATIPPAQPIPAQVIITALVISIRPATNKL